MSCGSLDVFEALAEELRAARYTDRCPRYVERSVIRITSSLWNGDAVVLLESFELVQHTASEIIAAITRGKPLPPEGGGYSTR